MRTVHPLTGKHHGSAIQIFFTDIGNGKKCCFLLLIDYTKTLFLSTINGPHLTRKKRHHPNTVHEDYDYYPRKVSFCFFLYQKGIIYYCLTLRSS